ncbi:hypothetical protein LCGC14_2937510 [marine sediment metagenome]|uniref:HNH nuclease domain-containing protein n=1 Tax=marine sediment metagenome TaxID=412755 RepID=A0A0F8Y643_9ZZZZ
MPKKPKHYCRELRCPNLADSGESYCLDHQRQRNRDFNKTRPTSAERGYNRAWQVYRAWYLKRHRLCVVCSKEGKTVIATIVDHIIPVSKGGDFWDESNHQSMCLSHHNAKTAREVEGFGK